MIPRSLCALFTLLLAVPALAATPCASLKSLTLPNVTITTAEVVQAGPFVPPGRAGGPPPAAAPGPEASHSHPAGRRSQGSGHPG